MNRPKTGALFAALLLAGLVIPRAEAALITQSISAVAIQNVQLLGIDAELVGHGTLDFRFDLGPDGNTATGGGTSGVLGFFQGFLPTEFTPLGVAGLPFDLSNDESVFSIPPEILTVTGGGTDVLLDSFFGLQIFDPTRSVVLATFYTQSSGLFQASGTTVPIPGDTVFQDPNRPNDPVSVLAGPNLLNIPVTTLVGVSFNRTVTTTVPEPSSLAICGAFALTYSLRNLLSRRRSQDPMGSPGCR